MKKTSARIALIVTAMAASLFGSVGLANAAEIKVLASVALTSALDDLTPVVERTTGNKLVIG